MKNFFAVLFMAGALCSSCTYCDVPANKPTAVCKTYRSIAQCGPKSVIILAGDIQDLISGDLAKVLADVLSQAPEEYNCFKLAVQNGIVQKFGAGSVQLFNFLAAASKIETIAASKGKK